MVRDPPVNFSLMFLLADMRTSVDSIENYVSNQESNRSPIPYAKLIQTAAYHAPLSMGFSRQEYWSGVPLPSPGLS